MSLSKNHLRGFEKCCLESCKPAFRYVVNHLSFVVYRTLKGDSVPDPPHARTKHKAAGSTHALRQAYVHASQSILQGVAGRIRHGMIRSWGIRSKTGSADPGVRMPCFYYALMAYGKRTMSQTLYSCSPGRPCELTQMTFKFGMEAVWIRKSKSLP